MTFYNKLFFIFSVSLLVILNGCTVSGADNELNLNLAHSESLKKFDEELSDEKYNSLWESLTDYQKEFEYVYEVFDYFYLFAHKDELKPKGTNWYNTLKKRTEYIGTGEYVYPDFNELYPSEILDIHVMAKSLNDVFTSYIDPITLDYDDFLDDFYERESLYDIGVNAIEVSNDSLEKRIVVAQIYKESPAESINMQINDTILELDGNSLESLKQFNSISEWNSNQKVSIKYVRNIDGLAKEFNDTLLIKPYISPSVTYSIIDSIAIINILEFASENTPHKDGTYGEFLEALENTKNTKATVIDLRENLGGDEDQCLSISEEMLSKNDILLVEHKTTTPVENKQLIQSDTLLSRKDGLAKDRYLVFVADTNSASCSEFTLMGVLDNKKSPLVGQITYGKGIGYIIAPTYLNGTLTITTTIVSNLNNESYHMVGIEPDVYIDDYDEMLEKAIEIAKEGTMVRTKGLGKTILPKYTSLKKSKPSFKTIPKRTDFGQYKVLKNNIIDPKIM